MEILNIFKICAFICMMCFYGVSYTMEVYNTKEGNLRDLIRIKRRSTIERRDAAETQHSKNHLNENLDELLNVMKREDEIQQELDILKHWQDLSAINSRHKRQNVGEFIKTARRRRALKGSWWGCPICDGTTKLVPPRPGCKCDSRQNDPPVIL